MLVYYTVQNALLLAASLLADIEHALQPAAEARYLTYEETMRVAKGEP